MSEPLLLIDRSDPAVTVVTLNRPDKRNALSIPLMEQIENAFSQAASDLYRRVVILQANGPSFCAGLDLQEAVDPANAHRSAEAAMKMFLTIGSSPLITIAAARGAAVGGGAGLVASCDFAIAADDLKIGYPEVHRGLVAALVSAMLVRQLGERAVRELILLGEVVDANRALGLGLINQIVPADRLSGTVRDLAARSIKGAPSAIAKSKRLIDSLSPRTLEEDLQRAMDFHMSSRQSPEAAEGMAAFLEKRPPKWGPREND